MRKNQRFTPNPGVNQRKNGINFRRAGSVFESRRLGIIRIIAVFTGIVNYGT